jgi:hypothetical protein
LIGVAVMLATTACRAEAAFMLDLAEDGSGTYEFQLGADQELQSIVSSDDFGNVDLFAALEGAFPDIATERRTEGAMTFLVGSSTFADTAELQALLDDAGAQAPFDVTVTIEDGTVRVDGRLELTDVTALADLDQLEAVGGLDPAQLEELVALAGPFAGLIDQVFAATLVVVMPGTVTDTNADVVGSDGRLEWTIPISADPVEIRAVSELEAAPFPWIVVIIAAAAVLALAGVWWVTRRRRRQSVAVLEAAGSASAPPRGWDATP